MKNSLAGCQITKTSNEISYMRNGIEYCFVEVTCSDGTQYGLQAFWRRGPNRLYKEAYRCIMCGSTPREPKRSAIEEESIDGKKCVDSNGCALIFRRLRNVMGEESVALLA